MEYNGEVIAKELIRDRNTLDEDTRTELDDICRNWQTVWHGTRCECLKSILRKGLLPGNSDGIKIPKGHIKLGVQVRGVSNWAAAIFVSPSVRYASQEAYSERVNSGSQQWCVLVKAYCKPASYEPHKHTLHQYDLMGGEPEMLEYRVPVNCCNLNVESARNVVVHSLMFVPLRFLQNMYMTSVATLEQICI